MNETPKVDNNQAPNDQQNQISPSGEKNGYRPDADRLALFEELQAIAPTVDGKTRADLEGEGYSWLESFIFSNGETGHINAGEIKRILAVLKMYPEVNKTHKYAIVLSADKDRSVHEIKFDVMMKAKDPSEITFEDRAAELEAAARANAIARDTAPRA